MRMKFSTTGSIEIAKKKLWHVQNGKCIEFNEYENVHKFFRRFFFHETSSKKINKFD